MEEGGGGRRRRSDVDAELLSQQEDSDQDSQLASSASSGRDPGGSSQETETDDSDLDESIGKKEEEDTTTPMDAGFVSKLLKHEDLTPRPPSKFKIGFLGMGIMGRGIVKNLLSSGHNVIIWNRSPDKIKDFIDVGAEQGMTPSEVVSSSDITFACVADSQASKELIFGINGVLQAMANGKSYVEMTGIDVETSKDIEEVITCKGGRYLEAQLQGSHKEAEDGELVVLCSGDKSLYDDCSSAFTAMGKTAFFLNNNAAKMNSVHQVIAGVTLCGLAEGMALADRLGLEMKDVMKALSVSSVSCPLVNVQAKRMCDGSFKTQTPLKHMQKGLSLALGLGNEHNQPMPLAAIANEVLKRLGNNERGVGLEHQAQGQWGRPPQMTALPLLPGPSPTYQGNQSGGLGIPSPPSSTASLPPTLFGPISPVVAPTPADLAPPYSEDAVTSKPPTGRRTRSYRGK